MICDSAVNRHGVCFEVGEQVIVNGYHHQLDGRSLIIKEIYDLEECESGKMIWLEDAETGKLLKRPLDTNWLTKNK